ncbi:MAG TPA: phage minor head protein [Burkholderiaceae bacterium]|nr:phage minor head protein [Burkholderiaceae bacterium]HNG80625.1 phage minor head protein [Burkholderiaceae bacterium]
MATPANLALAMALPHERAIEYFQAKGLRVSSRALDLAPEAHARAFTVAGVLKAEALQDIRSAMERAIADGQTFEEFKRGLKAKLKTQGWWGVPTDPETGEILPGRAMTPHRLRTVFQTNTQSAYMAGRYKAQLENADQRPYWQYVAILDSRTRPRHRSLNGRIFRYDDPAWGVLYPPNGYNCRCRVKALSADEFAAEGGALSQGEGRMETVEADLGPRGGKVTVRGYRDPATQDFFGPDPGFDSNPGAGAYGLDVALARRVQALPSREIRTQVWQALNNSPLRLAQFRTAAAQALEGTARAGRVPQVLGFVAESLSAGRVVTIGDADLVSAARSNGVGEDGLMALPGVIARPDATYTRDGAAVLVRQLDDGLLCVELPAPTEGRIDLPARAYRLKGEAAKQLGAAGWAKVDTGV